jgi:hypothetical protein
LFILSQHGFTVDFALAVFVAVNCLMYFIMLWWFFRITIEKHYAV